MADFKVFIRLLTAPVLMLMLVGLVPAAALAGDDLGYSRFSGASGPSEEGFFVATDPEGWHRLWSIVGKPAKGTFRPGKTTGVGIFLGPRPDGDRLRVRKVQDDDGRIEVKLSHKQRASSGETITPWVIVLIKGTGTEVVADIRHEAVAVP